MVLYTLFDSQVDYPLTMEFYDHVPLVKVDQYSLKTSLYLESSASNLVFVPDSSTSEGEVELVKGRVY